MEHTRLPRKTQCAFLCMQGDLAENLCQSLFAKIHTMRMINSLRAARLMVYRLAVSKAFTRRAMRDCGFKLTKASIAFMMEASERVSTA